MSLIPEDKLHSTLVPNLAPMIDFVFLMLAFFATLAVTRASLYDTQLELVKISNPPASAKVYSKDDITQINLSVTREGTYKWITEIQDYPMESLEKIQNELFHHYNIGALPKDKNQTQILLHIDKNASWEPIAKLIFAIKETGFDALPIYKADESKK
jgi:biopolymer transport protein ExbD